MASSSSSSRTRGLGSKTSIMIFRTNDFIGIASDSRIGLASGRALSYDTNKIQRMEDSIFMVAAGSRQLLDDVFKDAVSLQPHYPPRLSALSVAIPTTDIVNRYMSSQLNHLYLQLDKEPYKKEMKRLRTEIYFIDRYSVVKLARERLIHTPWNHSHKVVDPNERVIFGGSGSSTLKRAYSDRFGQNGENHPANMELEACVEFLMDCIREACQEDWGTGGRINVVVLGQNFCRRKILAQKSTRFSSFPHTEILTDALDYLP